MLEITWTVIWSWYISILLGNWDPHDFWNIFGAMLIVIVFIIIVVITTIIIIICTQFFSYLCRLMTMNKPCEYLLWRAENWALNWFISLLVRSVYYPSIRKRDDIAFGNCIHIPPLSKLFSWLRHLLGVLSNLKIKKIK